MRYRPVASVRVIDGFSPHLKSEESLQPNRLVATTFSQPEPVFPQSTVAIPSVPGDTLSGAKRRPCIR